MIEITLSSGRLVYIVDESWLSDFCGYDRTIAEIHIANCGHIIIDEYNEPIDNEYDCNDAYDIVNNIIKEK